MLHVRIIDDVDKLEKLVVFYYRAVSINTIGMHYKIDN